MFHDGHELDSVVPQLLDAGQDVGRKLCELSYTPLRRGNAD